MYDHGNNLILPIPHPFTVVGVFIHFLYLCIYRQLLYLTVRTNYIIFNNGALTWFRFNVTFVSLAQNHYQGMKPTKKSEILTLKKSLARQPAPEEVSPVDTAITSEPVIEQQPDVDVESLAPEYFTSYAPVLEYPTIRSVANSGGWQASDIWRELRVDGLCD